jgi:tape measure domain-containing protein
MATEVGNIHIGLYVDVGESRRFSDVANIVERDSRRMNSALGSTTSSVRALRTQMNQSLRFRIAQESLKNLSQATNEVSRLRAAMLGLAAITGTGVTGAFTAAYLVQTADKARLLGNQIRTVTADTAEFASVQDELFNVSQRTRTSLEATTQIYARTARATETYRYSQEKLLRVTETIQKAFAIGGATPQEAQGAAIQLSQGIASNRFGGEEFRSVAENAPVLLRGIAESLNVTIGKLREMSQAGMLTAQVVVDAIVKAGQRIDKEFATTLPTVAQSFTLLDNAFIRYIGRTDETFGVSKKLSASIKGLADNFEDVMYWVTRGTAAIAAFYAVGKTVGAGQNRIASIKMENAAIREMNAKRIDQNKEMAARLIEIEKEIVQARQSVSTASSDAADKRAKNISAAETKQVDAVKRVNQLTAERNGIVDRLRRAQNDEINALKVQAEQARQRVRDDQMRVIQAQEAAAAEERNLRARQAQALVKIDQQIGNANNRVFQTLDRVGQAESAIRAEKDLAKAKIAGEIDSRREMLVTSSMRLRDTQRQIADLRSLQDLSDFEKVYGAQYRGQLKAQQQAISSISKVRKEIDDLQGKMSEIDSGGATTKGITSAMNRHAQAVKQAELAVQSLAKVEAKRMDIAAGEIKGKSLDARIAAEVKELERYRKSVDDLQQRMSALKSATEGAFSGAGVQKSVREIEAFDKKIVAAQNNLKVATAAVSAAQADGGEQWAAALNAQARAAQQVNDLNKEGASLLERQNLNTVQLIASQQRLNTVMRVGSAIRKVGSGILDFFGGGVGLGLTVALVGASALMAKFAMDAQKSAEETARITKQLTDLGYLTGQAADEMGRFQDNVSKGRVSKLQTELDAFSADLKKTVKTLKDIDFADELRNAMGSATEVAIPKGATSDQVRRLRQQAIDSIDAAVGPLKGRLASIRDELVKNKSMSAEARKALEDMALANPQIASVTQPLIEIGDRLNGLKKAAEDWLDALRKAREEQNKNPQQRFGEYMEEEARIRAKYDQGVTRVTSPEIAESAMSEYDSQIKKTMDSLIKKAKELGETLLESDAKRAAEIIYANDVSKKGLRDLIGLYEGTDKGRGYNETLGYGRFTGGDVNLTSMTLREVLELQRNMLQQTRALPSTDPNYNSSAVGRYQIVSTTLKGLIDKLGLSLDQAFTPELQDRLADQLIRGRGRSVSGLRNEWQGLNRAPGEQILRGFDQTSLNLPMMDESVQKWIDGMKDLNLQSKVAGFTEFNKKVMQTAESMGASNDELKQYADAVSTGKLDQIPPKFQAIAESMKQIEGVELGKAFTELQTSNLVPFLSDANQKVVEVARSLGVAEEKIRAFVQASLNGGLTQVAPEFARIQLEVEKTASDERIIKFADGAAEAVGGLVTNLVKGTGGFKDFLAQLGDLALQILIIEPLVESLKGSFRGLASGGGGGGIGGVLGFIPKLFGLFDKGGYTGSGNKYDVAGLVHADEYVFSKEAVNRIGVANLDMLHAILKNGKLPEKLMSLPGFSDGGFTGYRPSLPGFNIANDNMRAMASSMPPAASNITIGGAKIVVQGNADKPALVEMQRMLADSNKKLIKEIPGMVDSRTNRRNARKDRP